jgi:hypothetical protein
LTEIEVKVTHSCGEFQHHQHVSRHGIFFHIILTKPIGFLLFP